MQALIGNDGGLAQTLAQRLQRSVAALAEAWRRLVGDTAYRPEKHYMRGPGPKWRAKHAAAEAIRRHTPQDAARGS